MGNPPFHGEDVVDAARPELDPVSVQKAAGISVGGDGMDQAALEIVDLHIGVDSAEEVGGPVWVFGLAGGRGGGGGGVQRE